MKQIRRIIMLCMAVCTMTLAQAQDQLKVITFNIKSFENSNFDVKPFAKLLAEENADIICLNEVENRSARQMDPKTLKYRDVVQDLAANLKLFGVFGYSYNLMNKKGEEDESKYTFCQDELYGNAILSRYPILNINAMQLPRPANSADQRGVVTAEILLPSGKMVRVACTHLDHIGGQMEQAKVLVGGNVLSATIPTILTGDMNQWPGTEVIKLLDASYDRLCQEGKTYQAGSKLDYIYGSKGAFEVVEKRIAANVCDGVTLSDHFPVISVIKFK